MWRNQWIKSEDQACEQVFEDPVVLLLLHRTSSYTKHSIHFVLRVRDNSLHFLQNFQIKSIDVGLGRDRYVAISSSITALSSTRVPLGRLGMAR